MNCLSDSERSLLTRWLDELPDTQHIPSYLRTPRTISSWLSVEQASAFPAEASGLRSAYCPQWGAKFKGCHPVRGASEFPCQFLRFGDVQITHSSIPYGVLTCESVMREILGYCFLHEKCHKPHFQPICVYEYYHCGISYGYCLVLITEREERVGSYVDFPPCTVADLLKGGFRSHSDGAISIVGTEVNLKRINSCWYAEQKAARLANMHYHGGFRGVLNSNIGNDVLIGGVSNPSEIALCDFDSFHAVEVPEHSDEHFIRDFALLCLAEVAAGSLPILDFVSLDPKATIEEHAEELRSMYMMKSSLWRAYLPKFFDLAATRNWSVSMLENAVEHACRTSAFVEAVSICIFSAYKLRSLARSTFRVRY